MDTRHAAKPAKLPKVRDGSGLRVKAYVGFLFQGSGFGSRDGLGLTVCCSGMIGLVMGCVRIVRWNTLGLVRCYVWSGRSWLDSGWVYAGISGQQRGILGNLDPKLCVEVKTWSLRNCKLQVYRVCGVDRA